MIARSELPKEAPPIRDVVGLAWSVGESSAPTQFVVGVGARDREGARRALSMAFALASSTSDEPKGARVYIIYVGSGVVMVEGNGVYRYQLSLGNSGRKRTYSQ